MELILNPPYVLCDLDGVVFDHRHRLGLIAQAPKQWDAYYAASDQDPLIAPTVRLVKGLQRTGYEIVFTTGRPRRVEQQTLGQIMKAFPLFTKWNILMRQEDCFLPNVEIKAAHLKASREFFGQDPFLAIDDLAAVCKMYRKEGIPTLQLRLPR